jgi:hypothetical protein
MQASPAARTGLAQGPDRGQGPGPGAELGQDVLHMGSHRAGAMTRAAAMRALAQPSISSLCRSRSVSPRRSPGGANTTTAATRWLGVRDGQVSTVTRTCPAAAVDNLLDNALRAAPAGHVQLRGYARGEHIIVQVDDDGPGFAASFLPVGFERFRRADTVRDRDAGGAGLGLAIVKAIAEAHSGTAEASNRQGGGASVRIILPARQDGGA